NEIDTAATPLKPLRPGEEVLVEAHDKTPLGIAYLNPHSLIAARLLTRDPHEPVDLDFFIRKLRAALHLRTRLFHEPYYRLVFSEADGLPGIVIDRFGNDLVMQVNTAGMEQKIDLLSQALTTVLPDMTSLLLRNDSPIREQEGLACYVKPGFGTPPDEIIVRENGVQFFIPLWKGQKTGWFYDHRMNRARLRDYVPHQTVLDVFSYMGGWGLQAAHFGAERVDCIETSAIACDFIQRNAKLNHLEHKIMTLCDDAFDAMKQLLHQHKKYDVIILDPPAFVKRFKDRKEGLIAYQRLNELALKLLTPFGILFSCSCSMHVSQEDLLQLLQRAAFRTQSQLQVIERGHQGPDHPLHPSIPETDYLKAVVVRKVN
ncbi:MAG: class I SAM-dependent rRNA methyltransferase, partial [Gammaproteobacteria bacterium]